MKVLNFNKNFVGSSIHFALAEVNTAVAIFVIKWGLYWFNSRLVGKICKMVACWVVQSFIGSLLIFVYIFKKNTLCIKICQYKYIVFWVNIRIYGAISGVIIKRFSALIVFLRIFTNKPNSMRFPKQRILRILGKA